MIRPSGTVTFLFTDIEGSTALWEAHPEQMRVALARHDGLVRDAIQATGGDGVAVAFSNAAAAVRAALGLLTALHGEDWPDGCGSTCGWAFTRERPTSVTATISGPP